MLQADSGATATENGRGGKAKTNKKKTKGNKKLPEPGPCHNCNETDQVNWLRVTQKQNNALKVMPWIETVPLTAEEAKKKRDAELAAKKAEVEARVRKAIEERETNSC
mmetsp:Transcript_22410/g.27385  ORF Transcript_22410/g.27385 Transcript_22410/m.27385 type:complete len:108 (+) Transcript_22410:43-366(+)